MKKLLPFIFVLIFGVPIKAQMWCPPGATWHYRVNSPYTPYQDGHIKLVVTNTVSINSITCNNMVGTFNGKTPWPMSPTTTINGYVNFQTYENNNVVYKYNPYTFIFDTIANFNANIGDKWLAILYPNNPSTCQSNFHRSTISVVDTGHVLINSISVKKIKISIYYTSSFSHTLNIIEKIGGTTWFLFSYDQCIVDGPSYGNFVCYSDDNFPLYNPTSTICNYVPSGVGVNENSLSNSIFKLYPNPTSGIFNMELNEPVSIKVYSVTGALVYERAYSESGNFQLDISHLSNGIYHLRTESSSGSSYSKLIKN
jgi:hypothetical protein